MIFAGCPPKAFATGLELGAGDGYQSRLLAHYVRALTVTDFAPEIAGRENAAGLTHQACDAERVDEVFPPSAFELIFSSNMMEHLPDPGRALAGMRRVLADGGVAIHIMPSPFWKFTQMVGFYPNAVITRLERYTAPRRAGPAAPSGAAPTWDNNPKLDRRRYSYLRRLLWPLPHGVADSNLAEFRLFRPAHWRQCFAEAGFHVVAALAGPISSGYGFGLERGRAWAEQLNLASEYAYVTVKAGQSSPFLAYFGLAG